MLPIWINWAGVAAGIIVMLIAAIRSMSPPRGATDPSNRAHRAYLEHQRAIEEAGGPENYKRKTLHILLVGMGGALFSALALLLKYRVI